MAHDIRSATPNPLPSNQDVSALQEILQRGPQILRRNPMRSCRKKQLLSKRKAQRPFAFSQVEQKEQSLGHQSIVLEPKQTSQDTTEINSHGDLPSDPPPSYTLTDPISSSTLEGVDRHPDEDRVSKRRRIGVDTFRSDVVEECKSKYGYHLAESNSFLKYPSLPESPRNKRCNWCQECRNKYNIYQNARYQRNKAQIPVSLPVTNKCSSSYRSNIVEQSAFLKNPSLSESSHNKRHKLCWECKKKDCRRKKNSWMRAKRMNSSLLKSTTGLESNGFLEDSFRSSDISEWTTTEKILLGIAWERFRPYGEGASTKWSKVAPCFPHRDPTAVQKYFQAHCEPGSTQFKFHPRGQDSMEDVARLVLRGGTFDQIRAAVRNKRERHPELVRDFVYYSGLRGDQWTSTEYILVGIEWERCRRELEQQGPMPGTVSNFGSFCFTHRPSYFHIRSKFYHIRLERAQFKVPRNANLELMKRIAFMLVKQGPFISRPPTLEPKKEKPPLAAIRPGDDEEVYDEDEEVPPSYQESVRGSNSTSLSDPPPMRLEDWNTKLKIWDGEERKLERPEITIPNIRADISKKRKREEMEHVGDDERDQEVEEDTNEDEVEDDESQVGDYEDNEFEDETYVDDEIFEDAEDESEEDGELESEDGE